MKKLGILAAAAAMLWSCAPDVTMHPEAYVEKGVSLVQKGNYEKAVEQYTAVIDRYCEHSEAYALRAVALAKLGRTDEALSDLVHSLRNGVDEVNAAVLQELAATCSESLEDALKNECTIYQTAGLMYSIGASAETGGRLKDALNAYRVAAGLDEVYAVDAERLADAESTEGNSDWEYFTRTLPDGTSYTNLRVLDPYMGGEVPAEAAGKPVPSLAGNSVTVSGPHAPSLVAEDYPELAKALGVEGTVTLRVSVNSDGSARYVRLVTPVHFSLDSESVRLASAYDWSDLCGGRAVTYILPVNWKLK